MKYTLHLVEDDQKDFYHVVYETATEQVIDYFFFEEDAIECALFLNKGGAFDGFTPAFMLRELVLPLDTKFSHIVG